MRRLPAALAALALLAACGGDDGGADDATTTSASTSTTAGATTTTEPATTTTEAAVDGLGGFVPAPLQWAPCGGGIECATLAVPLDWADVAGPAIELALRRAPATGDPADHLGAVAYNLGGPGASTVGTVSPGLFGSAVGRRYDVLGWDVRGVGGSTPLTCGDQVEPFLRLDNDPDDAAEQAALDAAAAAVAQECAAEDGAMLPHVGTDDVARDLEAIRLAGGVPLAYVGFSYGTLIGLRYLDLFPTSPTRVVLDGVVDPEHTLTDLLRGQATGFERTAATLFAACPDGGTFQGVRCPAGGAAAAYDRVAAAVEQAPLPAGTDVLGPSDLSTALAEATYTQSSWARLYAGLRDADERGDGAALLAQARSYRSFGSFPLYYAVSCLDSRQPEGAAAWTAFAEELAGLSARIGTAVANEMAPCAVWPAPPRPVTGPVVAEGSPPVLVIGTTGDAATPVEQAERVASTLADGHLLVFEGEGHTAYFSSACVDAAVEAYLLSGALPAEGARC